MDRDMNRNESEQPEAIISLTTTPRRLPYIGACIESLKRQELPVYVWVQERVERTGEEFDGLFPSFLVDCEVAVVPEQGPITKLLPALGLHEVVITVDDDVEVGPGWAEGLLEAAERLPGAAVGYRGRQMRGRKYNESRLVGRVKSDVPVDIMTNGWGGLYHSEWFDESIHDEWQLYPSNDNLVIDAHLKRRGVRRFVIPCPCTIRTLPVHKIGELWQYNQHHNDEGLEKLGWWKEGM